MITVDQLPEKAIDAARLAMAVALADDGDCIPECIAAALNAWPGMVDHSETAMSPRCLWLPLMEKPDDKV